MRSPSLALLLLLLLVLAPTASAQLEINEVLYDPAGPDLGAERVEVVNAGGSTVDTGTWQLCVNTGPTDRVYWSFPSVSLDPGDVLVVHWREDGVDTTTDLFTGSAAANFDCFGPLALDNAVGSVSLYEDAFSCFAFFDASLMRDFVQWGGSTFREAQAVTAGLWTTGAAVDVVAEGSSIAYDGTGSGASAYFEDVSPTLGEENAAPGSGLQSTFGSGCLGSGGVPAIGSAGGPPVLGNASFTVEVGNGLVGAPTAFAIGLAATQVPLGGGCDLLVSPVPFFDLLLGETVDASGVGRLALPIPDQPSLVGASVFVQAFVIDAASPQGAAAFSDGLRLDV